MKQSNAGFRDYEAQEANRVADFYRQNHEHQTLAFARQKQQQYAQRNLGNMGIWQACELLDTLIDDSDPDTSLSQLEHLLQTAEAIRTEGLPDWFQLTGLIHDLGKILCLKGEPQWAVVGDTFPLGCKFSEKIVHSAFFDLNPDAHNTAYQSELGIYEQHCGLDQVTMSFGHDEYLYQVTKQYLPIEAQYIIRYHSFYSAHTDGEYRHLMNDLDLKMFKWVKQFQAFDLYSKADKPPNVAELRPYYEALIDKFFPPSIRW